MALTAARNTEQLNGTGSRVLPVRAGAVIYQGALIVLDAGAVRPGLTKAGVLAAGRARASVTGGITDGDTTVTVDCGVFGWANSAGADEITGAQIGRTAFIVDDQTVAATDGGGLRSPAGRVFAVDARGVWVESGQPETPAFRTPVALTVHIPSLATAGGLRVVCPVAGTISKIRSVINGGLSVGDATLTAAIGATAITNGVVTITQAGSGAGDVDAATPTAANLVAVGDVLTITVGGTNTAAVSACVTIEISV
jgi:hypothetical protein